jgi:hypothetical protein
VSHSRLYLFTSLRPYVLPSFPPGWWSGRSRRRRRGQELER